MYLKKFIGEKIVCYLLSVYNWNFVPFSFSLYVHFIIYDTKRLVFLPWRKPQPMGGSSFWNNWLKSSNENREMVLIFIILKVIPRSCLTQIQCSYKFNKFCKGNSSNSCEKNVINRSQNKCHFEICQLLMDS